MSQINYDIYGSPETWRVWSDSPISNVLWGTCRVGASTYDDPDFTDYPPTMIGVNDSLKALYTNNMLDINEPIDNSLAYTAIANPDLPQANIGVFSPTNASINNPLAVVDNSKPIPFSFGYYNDLNSITNPTIRQTIQGFDGFPNNATVMGAQSLQRWSPFASCQTTNEDQTGYYNPSGYVFPILSWGIKSIFFEINVRYRKPNNDLVVTTFKSYLNNTSEWLHDNQISGAWLVPYYRINVNGEYSDGHAYMVTYKDRVNGINPIFYTPYRCKGYDVYNYTGNYARNAGCLPIWGNCITDGGYSDDRLYSRTYDTPTQTTIGSYCKIYGYNKGNISFTPSDNYLTVIPRLDLSIAENIEYIMRGAAAYGVFFCLDASDLKQSGKDSGASERWLDENMYCGIIRSDGMTYGEYSKGLYNAERDQYEWKDSTQTPFVPSQDINQYSNQTRIRAIGHIDTMCDRYVLNANAVNALSVDLFTIMSDLSVQQTDWGNLIEKTLDSFLVQNPVDCIVSLKKYPVKEIPNTGDLTNIHYGRYSTGSAAGYPCTADVYTYAFTPKRIQPRFGNSYLDYEPNTSAELYIPYCGSISLKMCDILDKQLEPFLCVDYHTGQCTGFVMADGIVIETIQGTIAIDVPITGIQTATVESQLMQSANASRSVRVNQAFSVPEGIGKVALGTMYGGPIGGATGFANAVHTYENLQFQKYQADYDLTHTAAPQHVIGSSSSACGWIIDSDTARLILYYPTGGVIDDANPPSFIASRVTEFGSIYGFATIESGTLGSYPGFTTATEMILHNISTEHGAPATEPELEMIRSAISEGVIIPITQ